MPRAEPENPREEPSSLFSGVRRGFEFVGDVLSLVDLFVAASITIAIVLAVLLGLLERMGAAAAILGGLLVGGAFIVFRDRK